VLKCWNASHWKWSYVSHSTVQKWWEQIWRFVLFEIPPNFFDRFFAALAWQLNKISVTIPQAKRKFARLIEKSLLRNFELAKYRWKFTSNEMKYPPTFWLQEKLPNKRRQNVNNHFSRVLYTVIEAQLTQFSVLFHSRNRNRRSKS